MIEFFQTRMGQRFFESTVPRLVEELARLNQNLELIAKSLAPEPATDATAPNHED